MKQNIRIFQWSLLILDTVVIWSMFFIYGKVAPHSLSDYLLMAICYLGIIMCQYSFKGYVLTQSKSLSRNLISCFQGLIIAAFISSFVVFLFDKHIPKL